MVTGNREKPSEPLLDTQLIIHAMNGKPLPGVERIFISSVTAQEFLLQYSPTGAGLRYGLATTRPSAMGGALAKALLEAPLTQKALIQRSQLLVHMDGETVHREYLHAETTHVVNAADEQFLRVSIRHLDKQTAKAVLARFLWIVSQQAVCVPLTKAATAMTEDLYRQFTKQFTPKARRENSVRDLLILATALTLGRDLLTSDRLLGEFAADYLAAPVTDFGPGVRITINNRTSKPRRARDRRGSRGSYRYTLRR
jgi:predicted nucleic acid-binding protein